MSNESIEQQDQTEQDKTGELENSLPETDIQPDSSEEEENTPVPIMVKLLLAGLLVFFILVTAGAVYFIKYSSSETQPTKNNIAEVTAHVAPSDLLTREPIELTSEKPIDDKNSDQIAEESDSTPDEQLVANASPEDILNRSTADEYKITSRDDSQDESISNFEMKLSALKKNIEDNNAEIILINKQLSEKSRLDEKLAKNNQNALASLSQRIAATTETSKQNSNSIASLKSIAVDKPAFTLLSIDEWGGSMQAVLEMNGYTSLASLGDIKAGWIISEIQKTHIKCERLNDGLEYLLKRKGGL